MDGLQADFAGSLTFDDDRLLEVPIIIPQGAPNEGEMEIITAALERERRQYRTDQPGAEKLLSVGESPRTLDLPAAEHAAWTNICGLLLNLSEAVTRR